MKISSTTAFVLLLIFSIGLFSGSAFGEDKKEVPVFTNQDIEKYKKPSDNLITYEKPGKASDKKDKAKAIIEEKEKEYWCKKATFYKRSIEKAQAEIQEAEKILSDIKDANSKKEKVAEKKLERAKKNLSYAEKDLADIEAEAHRKGIPPGWLRCQFE